MLDRARRLRWVLLVTKGLAMAYPAEVYGDKHAAEREAERWAWTLSEGGRVHVERPFTGRWEVGDTWIRVVQTCLPDNVTEVWVGTHWTRDGYPEPEATLFSSRTEALLWAITPPPEGALSDITQTPWLVAASFAVRGTEENSIVQLAKVVS